MGGQDLRYINGIVVDYFVFEWITNVITWYVYNIFLPGRYIIVVITFTRSMLSVDVNQPVYMNSGQYTFRESLEVFMCFWIHVVFG